MSLQELHAFTIWFVPFAFCFLAMCLVAGVIEVVCNFVWPESLDSSEVTGGSTGVDLKTATPRPNKTPLDSQPIGASSEDPGSETVPSQGGRD